jgi:iron(III) transport system permease protein
MPPYLLGLAWSALALPHTMFNRLFGPFAAPLGRLIFSLAGIAFVTASHLVPLVYVMLRGYLSGTGGRYELAALVHGISRRRAFLSVTLPRLAVPLAAGMLLAFLAAIEEFGVPAILGPYTGLTVLTTAVQHDLDVWPINLTGAVRTATVLLLLGAFAWSLYRRFDRAAGLDYTGPRRGSGRRPGWGGLLVAAWAIVTGILPLLTVAMLALLRAETAGLQWRNITAAHFAEVLRPQARGLRALTTSVELALGAAALSLVLASGIALAQRSGRPGDRALDLVTTLLAALPGIVLAVALVLVWNAPWNPVPLYGHRGILLLAYTTVLLPLALRYAKTAAARVAPELVVAARVHGVPGAAVLGRIVLPLMLPPLLGGGVLAFAFGVREFVTSVLLQPPGVDTVSTFIFSEAQQGNGGAAMAMSMISLAVSLAAVAALRAATASRGAALLRAEALPA